MAKEYLTVNGKLVMIDGKLVQVPDADNLNDIADENGAYATQGLSLTDEIENLIINGVIDGSPRGVYDNLEALQTAYPSGSNGVYLTSDNGHWYYWNGSAWTDGGVYQSSYEHVKIDDNIFGVDDFITYLENNNIQISDYRGKIVIFESVESEPDVGWCQFILIGGRYDNEAILTTGVMVYGLYLVDGKYQIYTFITDYELNNLETDINTKVNKINTYINELKENMGTSTNALTPTIVDELPTTGEVNKLYIKRLANTTQDATFTYDGHTIKAPEIPDGHYLTMIAENEAMVVKINNASDIDLNTYYLCCVSKNGTIYTSYSDIVRFDGEPDEGAYTTRFPDYSNIKWYKINKTNVETNTWELVAENTFAYWYVSDNTYDIKVRATTCPHGTGYWNYTTGASGDFSRTSEIYDNRAIGYDYGSWQLELITLISNSYLYEYYLMNGELLYQITTNTELNKFKAEMNTKLGDIETLLSEV